MNPIQRLTELGQSFWYDNIERRLLENGEFAAMIQRGDIRGVTSNPSIFNNAIAKSSDYDSAILPLAWSGWSAEDIFWQLAYEDIRAAADLFMPLYEQTNGGDGYVSLEVSPYLANNTEATAAQAKHLWETVNRPNLMIKIPATAEGIPAIRRSIAAGINVNVTLIFSLVRYAEVMEAYILGLEDRLASGHSIDKIASVASFFVSRVDTKVDGRLAEGSSLRGQAAIANAKLAYEMFLKVFSEKRFIRLQEEGARIQRPLWASTSTKNPAYPDTLYVDNLIGMSTVNTVPPNTLEAFREHGKAQATLNSGLDDARHTIAALEAMGISMAQVTQELEDEGVKAFADAFTDLLATLEKRRVAAEAQLGPLSAPVKRRVARLVADAVPARIWSRDPTVWTNDPAGQKEVSLRMGWLDLPKSSRAALPEIGKFAESVRADGFTHAVVIGMGGSSLAPEVISLVFAGTDGLDLSILDSTDPAQVAEKAASIPLDKTLFIVSSKSGGTAEVMANFNYFWQKTGGNGVQFVAITDPTTSLEGLALARGFRHVFRADPSVGGRYSALTHFGLVPAALAGVDLSRALARAAWMMRQSGPKVAAQRNPGLMLGVVMAEAALAGRDKLTLLTEAGFTSFGSWVEQLVAESSGKEGKGILPVDLEPVGNAENYGADRLFVYLRQTGEHDEAVAKLREAGHPALELQATDLYSLFSNFYLWEFATAVACAVLGVNAFDQPNVEEAKIQAKKQIAAYAASGRLEEGQPLWEKDGFRVYSKDEISGRSARTILENFVAGAVAGDYVAINAFLPRNASVAKKLSKLRQAIRSRTRCAVTVGFGPRFLHSTGQLHKGGPNSGLFIVLTADPAADFDIPTQNMTFGTLELAQALGDTSALEAQGRRVLRIHLPSVEGLSQLL
jgi:transaldolase/glucose-6-phosphate isomerase